MTINDSRTASRTGVHARSAHTRTRGVAVVVSLAFVLLLAMAPGALAASWGTLFNPLRPAQSWDARSVIVEFDDPALADVPHRSAQELAALQKRQDQRIAALRKAGIEFDVRHSYLRTINGVALTLHSDTAMLLVDIPGVRRVTAVRAIHPFAVSGKATQKGAAAALPSASGGASVAEPPTVAIVDSAIDFAHPMLDGRQADAGYSVVHGAAGPMPRTGADHGTQLAGVVATHSARGARLSSIEVLTMTPGPFGVDVLSGRTDDLIAGLEHAVDPNGDGRIDDRADVVLVASGVPYASFVDAPEMRAASGAQLLGSTLVAAAGNDGPGDSVRGTIASPAGAPGVVSVGAADARTTTARVEAHVRGGLLDARYEDLALLTPAAHGIPGTELSVVSIAGSADRVTDYLDAQGDSMVSGKAVLIDDSALVPLAHRVRAAADAGARLVIVKDADAALAGTLDGPGINIAAISLGAGDVSTVERALRDADVSVSLTGTIHNLDDASVARFSSGGPTHAGEIGPSVVAPGVGIEVPLVGMDEGRGRMGVANGTSLAAAYVAAQAADLTASHPRWSNDNVRSAIIGGARAIAGDAHTVRQQGAGLVAPQADPPALLATPALLSFGAVDAGTTVRAQLTFTNSKTGTQVVAPPLAVEHDGDSVVHFAMANARHLEVTIDHDAAPGVHGGWITTNGSPSTRIPWMVVIRNAEASPPRVSASLDRDVLRPRAAAGALAAHLTLAVSPRDAAHALAAYSQLDIMVVPDSSTRKAQRIGRLTDVLAGEYEIGITGRTRNGAALPGGKYHLRVRGIPSGDTHERSVLVASLPFTVQAHR